MNDQNLFDGEVAVPYAIYESNIRMIIESTLRSCETDIVLVTPCEPNPMWKYTSGLMDGYAEVLRRLGKEYDIGVADVNEIWKQELLAGKTPESLLLNNINHPNDYGHWLYYRAFEINEMPL
jgi:lysophospholipase L1-like esterase